MVQREPLLWIENVSKSYYRIRALKDITFTINKGEILGLLGANGAGKSTLLKIIGGVEKADQGHIYLNGEALDHDTPHSAQQKGIISVYQEQNLFSNMTVAENLFIGREVRSKVGTINWRLMGRKAREALASLDLDLDPNAVVSSLTVAQRHMIGIARALNEEPKLLLLDEPTSALSENEIDWLFALIREQARKGTTIVYVSHRLDEVTELCERCVVLRDGALVSTLESDINKATIINNMIGHNVELVRSTSKRDDSEVIFECKNLYRRNTIKDVSFSLRKGEILGIAGLVGAGRTELLRTIFGVDKLTSGEIWMRGERVRIGNPKDAMNRGIALVPEDRKSEGLFLEETLRFNVSSATLERRARGGLIKTSEEKKAVRKAAESVQIDVGRMEHAAKLLSGGNQQKAVIAKTTLVQADILLLDEPTRGVDIGAREEIYDIIRGLAEKGRSIVLVSSDWEELLYLSDRIIAMAEGRIVGEYAAEEATSEKLLHLCTLSDVEKAEHTSESVQSTPKPPLLKYLLALYRTKNSAILIFMLAALVVIGSIIEPAFRSWFNMRNLMGQVMPYLILTIGQLVVIISGGLDLSSGTLLAASSVLGVSIMLRNPSHILLGVVLMLLFGLAVGAANAVLVIKAKVNSFVVTLGMSIILMGITLVITKNPIGPSPRIFRQIANNAVWGVPYILFIMIGLILLFTILLNYTALGRQLYAAGENPRGAYWTGLPVHRTQFAAFMISSVMAVLAALFMMGRTGAADPAFGPGMELIAIAAALIGGAVLGGGRGTLSGAILGVLILILLENILSLQEVELWYQEVIEGILLLAIIISYEIKKKRFLGT